MIYLDSAAMAPPLQCAVDAWRSAPFGNPSSAHAAGRAARAALEAARETVAACAGVSPEEIIFTATATEAAALALHSAREAGYVPICSPFEHHAVTENAYGAPDRQNAPGAVVCQMYANNETGEIFPFPSDKLNPGDLLLCDATAAAGHVPFPPAQPAYLFADALKFGGVPGAAFLVAEKGAPLTPLLRGGGQERGVRSGTENLPAICAMAAALNWQTEHMEENTDRLAALWTILFSDLDEIPNRHWNTPPRPRLPHILNVSFDGVLGEVLALLLSEEGVMVSAGAACSAGTREPSRTLMAMYRDPRRAASAIRLSLSPETTLTEIGEAAEKIKKTVAYLRSAH